MRSIPTKGVEALGALIAANDNRCDYYVYAWLRPSGEPFYVGKGRGNRDRTPKSNNPIFQRIVKKLRLSGLEPTIIRLHENLEERESFKLERAEIAKYGRRNNRTGILANLTDGGEGNSGWIPSDETKAKIGAKHAGKKLSADHRARLLEIVSNPSDETRAKLSASRIGKKASPRLIVRMILDNPAKAPSVRLKISAALKGMPKSDGHRAKCSFAASNRSEAHLAKISLANRMRPPQSGYKGVSYNADKGKWKVAIRIGQTRPFLGYFYDPIEAARAYDRAAIEAWGLGNCYLNLPIDAANDNEPRQLEMDFAS